MYQVDQKNVTKIVDQMMHAYMRSITTKNEADKKAMNRRCRAFRYSLETLLGAFITVMCEGGNEKETCFTVQVDFYEYSTKHYHYRLYKQEQMQRLTPDGVVQFEMRIL